MFSRISRYRKLPELVTTDARGRNLASKSLRILPEAPGTFRHTLEDGDRLDHLAYKYYRQPRKWWRICDANPEFMSPQELLGKEPMVTDRFPLTFNETDARPPWSSLLQKLAGSVGVEDVRVEESMHLVPTTQTLDGQTITVQAAEYERAVVVTYNRLNISAGELANTLRAAGFTLDQPQRIGRVGKQITIPRDVTG